MICLFTITSTRAPTNPPPIVPLKVFISPINTQWSKLLTQKSYIISVGGLLSTIWYSLVLYAKYNLHQNISTFLCFVCILCWICVQIVLHSPPRFIIKRSLCLSPVRKRTISCGFHKFRDKLHTNAEISSITLKESRT